MNFEEEETPKNNAAGGNEMFSVDLRTIQGDCYSYDIRPNDKVDDLIEKYMKDSGHSNKNVKVMLIMGGKYLDGKKTIKDYGITEGTTLNIMIRLKGGN